MGPRGSLASVTQTPGRGLQGSGQDAGFPFELCTFWPWGFGQSFPFPSGLVAKNPLLTQEM